jgi:hypothetical protein
MSLSRLEPPALGGTAGGGGDLVPTKMLRLSCLQVVAAGGSLVFSQYFETKGRIGPVAEQYNESQHYTCKLSASCCSECEGRCDALTWCHSFAILDDGTSAQLYKAGYDQSVLAPRWNLYTRTKPPPPTPPPPTPPPPTPPTGSGKCSDARNCKCAACVRFIYYAVLACVHVHNMLCKLVWIHICIGWGSKQSNSSNDTNLSHHRKH